MRVVYVYVCMFVFFFYTFSSDHVVQFVLSVDDAWLVTMWTYEHVMDFMWESQCFPKPNPMDLVY